MTTVSLVPNVDLATYTVVPGGTAAYVALSDSNDGTYCLANLPSIGSIVGFTTTTIPAGAVVASARLVLRGMGDSDNPETLTTLLQNAAGAQVATWTTSFPAGATPVDITTATTPILVADQATLDGLQMEIRRGATGVGVRVIKLSMPIVYAVMPVVTVTAPTGTIVTATPTATWTYTGDTDFGSQQRYQVKVFTAAQYGAGGFNPATSTPFYDSGEVVTSATATTIGPLSNAITFKAYVRAAQNVNGASHWSAWTAGPAFTTNTDPPAVSTIAAVVSDSAVQVTVTRDVAHPAWTHINLERSAGDALSWEPVRGALEVAGPTNTVVASDYEMPEGVAVWYRARGIIKSGAAVLSQGAWKVTSAAITWTTTGCGEYLRDPANPAAALLIEVVADEQTMTSEHRVGLLDVIGRASPVTVWDTPSLAAGMLPIVTRTYADAVALDELVRTAPVLLWQGRRSWGHPQRWLVITQHNVSRRPIANPAFADYRQWELAYIEVDPPPVLS
jgi:hypothetical protein